MVHNITDGSLIVWMGSLAGMHFTPLVQAEILVTHQCALIGAWTVVMLLMGVQTGQGQTLQVIFAPWRVYRCRPVREFPSIHLSQWDLLTSTTMDCVSTITDVFYIAPDRYCMEHININVVTYITGTPQSHLYKSTCLCYDRLTLTLVRITARAIQIAMHYYATRCFAPTGTLVYIASSEFQTLKSGVKSCGKPTQITSNLPLTRPPVSIMILMKLIEVQQLL